jgi:hypothetical protein
LLQLDKGLKIGCILIQPFSSLPTGRQASLLPKREREQRNRIKVENIFTFFPIFWSFGNHLFRRVSETMTQLADQLRYMV